MGFQHDVRTYFIVAQSRLLPANWIKDRTDEFTRLFTDLKMIGSGTNGDGIICKLGSHQLWSCQ